MRGFAAITALLLVSARAADDLPQRAPGEKMDFEPGLLTGLPTELDPVAAVPRLEAALDRARKSAAAGDRLFRAGVIAKVDAERRVLKIVRLESELAAARMEAANSDLAKKRKEFEAGSASQKELDAAQAATATASAESVQAAAAWQRAELAAAELNLSRQRQLVAAGVGSKTMLQRAQAQVAALKSKPPIPAVAD
jgi:hypothetical protein